MTAPSQTPAVPAPAPARPVAADLRKDDPRTAVDLWKRRLAATPEAVAFRYYDRDAWQGMTFGEADGIAREIAAGLVARGVVPGDRVCIVSQTRVEWVLCDIAIMLAGGIAVPIYASNTAEQCEFIVRDAGAKIVLVEDAAQRDKLVGLRNKLFTVAHVVQLTGEPPIGLTPPPAAGAPATSSRFVQSLAELRAAGRQWGVAHPGELDAHAETVAPESMFTIIYTSGTTGVPKGVVLTHENLTAGVSQRDPRDADRDDRRAVPVPAAGPRAGARAGVVRRSRWAARRRSRAAPRSSRRTWSRSGPRSWRACRASSRSSMRA